MSFDSKIQKLFDNYKNAQIQDKLEKVDSLLAPEDDDVEEQTFIKVPQKVYKPIDRLSRGLKIIKKLKDKGEIECPPGSTSEA